MYQVTCERDEEKSDRINSILFHSVRLLHSLTYGQYLLNEQFQI